MTEEGNAKQVDLSGLSRKMDCYMRRGASSPKRQVKLMNEEYSNIIHIKRKCVLVDEYWVKVGSKQSSKSIDKGKKV